MCAELTRCEPYNDRVDARSPGKRPAVPEQRPEQRVMACKLSAPGDPDAAMAGRLVDMHLVGRIM